MSYSLYCQHKYLFISLFYFILHLWNNKLVGTFLSVSPFSAYLLDINRHFSLCFAFQCLPFGSVVGTFLSVLLFGAYLLEVP